MCFGLPATALEEQEASSEGLVALFIMPTMHRLDFSPHLGSPFWLTGAMNHKFVTKCSGLHPSSDAVKTFDVDSSRSGVSYDGVSVDEVRKELD